MTLKLYIHPYKSYITHFFLSNTHDTKVYGMAWHIIASKQTKTAFQTSVSNIFGKNKNWTETVFFKILKFHLK